MGRDNFVFGIRIFVSPEKPRGNLREVRKRENQQQRQQNGIFSAADFQDEETRGDGEKGDDRRSVAKTRHPQSSGPFSYDHGDRVGNTHR